MSYLNYELDTLPLGTMGDLTFKLLHYNEVVTVLKHNGYKFINLSILDIIDTSRYYTYPGFLGQGGSYLIEIVNNTILGYIKQNLQVYDLHQINMSIIQALKTVALTTGDHQPRFVYAHLMLPHWPYLFDRYGNIISWAGQRDNSDKYLDQLIYINSIITSLVDVLLSRSPTEPIIIIQGDHGFRYLRVKDEGKIREGHTIFNAYYFPGGSQKLYSSITPVNSFRLLFNQYFGTSYDLLEGVDIKKLIVQTLKENDLKQD